MSLALISRTTLYRSLIEFHCQLDSAIHAIVKKT